MVDTIPTYLSALAESTLYLGVSGAPNILISTVAEVEGELGNEFDRQKHKGQNRARPRFVGQELAKFSVSFVVMPDEEDDFWNLTVPICRQKGKNGNAPALTCVNLQINRAGVNIVNVMKLKIGVPLARSGRRIRLELQEWAPNPTQPKPSTAATEQFDPKKVNANVKKVAKKS